MVKIKLLWQRLFSDERLEKTGNIVESEAEVSNAVIEFAIAILKKCYRAMQPNSKLLLVEMVIPPGNEPLFGKLLDLQMLVNYGGCKRTEVRQ